MDTRAPVIPLLPPSADFPDGGHPFGWVYVDVDFDFGAGPPQETSVRVTVPATWVADTTCFFWCVREATSTKNPEDALLERLLLAFENVVQASSFDAIAFVPDGTNGVFRVRICGVNT